MLPGQREWRCSWTVTAENTELEAPGAEWCPFRDISEDGWEDSPAEEGTQVPSSGLGVSSYLLLLGPSLSQGTPAQLSYGASYPLSSAPGGTCECPVT